VNTDVSKDEFGSMSTHSIKQVLNTLQQKSSSESGLIKSLGIRVYNENRQPRPFEDIIIELKERTKVILEG
jgi:hypothetical protein